MKKIILLSILLLCHANSFSQIPEKFNYQAVIRDASGNLRSEVDVAIQILILQGSVTSNPIYIENHNVRTSAFGLVNLALGGGSVDLGTFINIDWAAGPYFIKVKVDGVDYGSSEVLSVPYALYADKAGNGFSGNYNDLSNLPMLFDGTWASLTGKPVFATVATSGAFADLLSKPTTIAGYGITNAMSTTHPANAITSNNISNWTTAFGWGNHATAGYQPFITAGSATQYWRGDKTWQILNNAAVGLGNVENVRLSTWTGSSNLSTLGTITFGIWNAGAVTSSGAVSAMTFIKTGGTSSQFLKADGSVDANSYVSAVRDTSDEFNATSGQSSFTLTQTPSTTGKVKMYINGVRISNTAYSVAGNTLTYIPANNGSYVLTAGDRIQFDYLYSLVSTKNNYKSP